MCVCFCFEINKFTFADDQYDGEEDPDYDPCTGSKPLFKAPKEEEEDDEPVNCCRCFFVSTIDLFRKS